MTTSAQETGPGWRTLAGVGLFLLALAAVVWIDANRLPVQQTVGVGPTAGMRLIAVLVAILGVAHGVAAVRGYLRNKDLTGPALLEGTSVTGLAWVLGGLVGLVVVLEVGGGFILGATWLFVATARAFGQKLGPKSAGIGLVMTTAVFLCFTKALSLSLPTGPFERLLLG